MVAFPQDLLDGYRNFMTGRYAAERDRYHDLAEEGQTPQSLVIACCDSRSAPETIFDCGPGELFVLRNVANLVPPFTPNGDYHAASSAIEFAVIHLNVKNIVVMGHGRCGGIKAALATAAGHAPQGDFIGKWLTMLGPVADKVNGTDLLTATERETALERISVRQSVSNLMTFPFIKGRVAEGELALFGAWFDISTGELWVMDTQTGDFSRPAI